MNGKVDYLKLSFTGDALDVLSDVSAVKAWYADELEKLEEGKRSGQREYHRSRVNGVALAVLWECWGPIADRMIGRLPLNWWHRITRLDWREEIKNPAPFNRDELHKWCLERMHPRTRVTAIDAPPSHRRHGGRDSGGRFLGVGSHSGTRIIHNERVNEVPYTELQVGAKKVKPVIDRALDIHAKDTFVTLAEATRWALREEHERMCAKYFGRSLLVITGEVERVDTLQFERATPLQRCSSILGELNADERLTLLQGLHALHQLLVNEDRRAEWEAEDEAEELDGVAIWGVAKPGIHQEQINCATEEEARSLCLWLKEWEAAYMRGEVTFDEMLAALDVTLDGFTPLPEGCPRITPIIESVPLGPWINPSATVTSTA